MCARVCVRVCACVSVAVIIVAAVSEETGKANCFREDIY